MKIGLVSAALDQRTRGNHTTLRRWMSYDLGAELIPLVPGASAELEDVPDLFHGYHLLHGGVAAKSLAERYGRPLVVSLGGTDLFSLLRGDSASEVIGEVLRAADVVTGAFPGFGSLIGYGLPYVTVPRAFDPRCELRPKTPDGRLQALLAAGLRPVKDVLGALAIHRSLRDRGVPVELRVVGPPLDEEYAVRVCALASELEGVSLGELSPEAMAQAYREADVVWNNSRHEGGANSLIEALAHGCAVFARDVIGNRDFLGRDGAPGHLFFPLDFEGAERFHRGLLEETVEVREERARIGRAWLEEHASPRAEREALREAWRRALRG